MRVAVVFGLCLLPATAALAQEATSFRPFSPISGPNDSIPSPVCDVINFGFCPQPPSPPPLLPDPEADATPARATAPAPGSHRRRVHHRTVPAQG